MRELLKFLGVLVMIILGFAATVILLFSIWYFAPGAFSGQKYLVGDDAIGVFESEYRKCMAREVYTSDQCTVFAAQQAD